MTDSSSTMCSKDPGKMVTVNAYIMCMARPSGTKTRG